MASVCWLPSFPKGCLPLLTALLLAFPPAARAASFTDFEPAGFVAGQTVQNLMPDGTPAVPPITFFNQCVQAWFIPTATTDEEIVDLSGPDPAHGKVWRVSQGAAMGSLGQNPHSQHFGGVAGETGAMNDASCGAPTASTFYGELEFRSATGATQAGLGIAISANSSDTRHGFVRIFDDGAGFDLTFAETTDGCAFATTTIDTNLSYTDWHTLAIAIDFVDGLAAGTAGMAGALGNDVVQIFADGALVHTGTSWESCVGAESVDRLLIAASNAGSGTVIPAQLGAGLYIDNVFVGEGAPDADLAITKTDSLDPVAPGQPFSYTLLVSNAGPSAAGNVSVVDTLPAGVTDVAAAGAGWSCVVALPMVTCDLAALAVGPAAPIAITLDAPLALGTITNQATVSSANPDPDLANNTASEDTTVGTGPVIEATKDLPAGGDPGDTVFYEIVLSNLGSLDQPDNPGNEFEDTLPPELTLVAASASSGVAVAGPGNLATWNGPIAVGTPVMITLEATINAGTAGQVVSNQGTVFFDPDLDGTNDASAPTDDPRTPLLDDPTVFRVGGLLEIPTLSAWGLGLLVLLLAAAAVVTLQRHHQS